jgi:hypothetical protein
MIISLFLGGVFSLSPRNRIRALLKLHGPLLAHAVCCYSCGHPIRETEVYSLVCNIASYVIFDLLFESVALIDLHI